MQEQLDTYISDNHNIRNEHLFEKKFLALLVELGELANETRCFKFWSKQKGTNNQAILEEYVDNIHFLLSIGIEKGFFFTNLSIKPTEKEPTEQFNEVFTRAISFYHEQGKEKYLDMVQAYLQLAHVLGFTEDDIYEAYIEKNKVNFTRQQTGY